MTAPPTPGAQPPRRGPRVPRGVGIVAAWACGIGAAVLVAVLVFDIADGMLPTGSRTGIYGGAPSNQQSDVGAYWYTPAEAEALSAELATAVDGSGWCAGWSIVLSGETSFIDPTTPTYRTNRDEDVDDIDTTVGGDFGDIGDIDTSYSYGERADVGSSEGPGRSARDCEQWAEVEVVYEYTRTTASQEDNAAFTVHASDTALAQTLSEHPALQVSTDDLLHEDVGDNTDDVIGNAIAALPLALAETGVIDPLSVEPVDAGTEGAVTFEDSEGEGGSDLLATNRMPLLVGALIVLSGLTLICMAWGQVPAKWFRPAATATASRWQRYTAERQATGGRVGGGGGAAGAGAAHGSPRRALKAQMQRASERGGSS